MTPLWWNSFPDVLHHNDINSCAALRGMKFNPKKCKDMIIDFLHCKPCNPSPLWIGPSCLEQVVSYKLLGINISNNLSLDAHCTYMVKKKPTKGYMQSGSLKDVVFLAPRCIIRS